MALWDQLRLVMRSRLFNLLRRKGKRWRKMKNAPHRGHSARNGNMPSPYLKKKKVPYKYPFPTGKAASGYSGSPPMSKREREYSKKERHAA